MYTASRPGRPSIYSFVRAYIERNGGRLDDSGLQLPDEPEPFDPDATGDDSPSTPAFESELPDTDFDDSAAARELTGHMVAIAVQDDEDAKRAIYPLTASGLTYLAGECLAELESLGLTASPALHRFARNLIETAPDRDAVRFGILLLGGIGDQTDCELLALLGLHEAFAADAAAAIVAVCPASQRLLADMARRTTSWARVALVEQLGEADDAEVQAWLARGAIWDVLADYLALPCATGGDLAAALAPPTVDRPLIDSAGRILETLIRPGGGPDLDAYQDAPAAVTHYLRHVAAAAPDLRAAPVVRAIADYLEHTAQDTAASTWHPGRRRQAADVASRILSDPRWPGLVAAGIAIDQTWEVAYGAARALAIDVWETSRQRLQAQPFDSLRWYVALETGDQTRIEQVVQFALDSLPFAEALANDPGLPEPRRQATVDALVYVWQTLERWPGVGWPLLRAGLSAVDDDLRWRAVNAVSAWVEAGRIGDTLAAVRAAYAVEQDHELREAMQALLQTTGSEL